RNAWPAAKERPSIKAGLSTAARRAAAASGCGRTPRVRRRVRRSQALHPASSGPARRAPRAAPRAPRRGPSVPRLPGRGPSRPRRRDRGRDPRRKSVLASWSEPYQDSDHSNNASVAIVPVALMTVVVVAMPVMMVVAVVREDARAAGEVGRLPVRRVVLGAAARRPDVGRLLRPRAEDALVAGRGARAGVLRHDERLRRHALLHPRH